MLRKLLAFWLGFCFCLAPESCSAEAPGRFKTIGIYGWSTRRPTLTPFLKSCGYNTWQFIDTAWSIDPREHEGYYAKMAVGIKELQSQGFQVFGIVCGNVVQRNGQGAQGNSRDTFAMADKVALAERLEFIRRGVAKLRGADGFVFCSGDPGADHSPGSSALSAVELATRVQAIVAQEAPAAKFVFNAWSIAAWGPPLSAHQSEFWEQETSSTQQAVALPNFIAADVGIEFPLHNYYRALARKCYRDAGQLSPELYPQRTDVAMLRNRGVQHIVGWPYFLIDECDDGYTSETWGQSQSEVRYIHQLVVAAHELDLDGLVGNISFQGGAAELVNLFAFARFCQDLSMGPEQVLREFAAVVTTESNVDDLVEVLKFIENNSTAQAATPGEFRLPDFACTLNTVEEAQRRLKSVAPNSHPSLPLPESAAAYLQRLDRRLEVIRTKG